MSWLDNFINSAKDAVTNAVTGVYNTVSNAVQNVASGYSDWLNGNSSQQTPTQTAVAPATTPTDTKSTVQSTAPTGTAPTTPVEENQTTPNYATAPESVNTTPTTTTPVTPATGFETYEQYLQNNSQNIQNSYQTTIDTIDKQNKETLGALDEMLNKGNELVTGQYNETLDFNQQSYDSSVAVIKQLYETGKINAEEAKRLVIDAADKARGITYESAERARQEAETSADVARQRAVIDASSAYEQNKSNYGAKAEALGNMGLAGGGYSDWIDSAAYAQNRAQTQAANAESERAKREAKYAEDQTKLDADLKHTETSTQAELDYLNKMGELDTTYATNMNAAEQTKLNADKEAKDIYEGQLYQNESEHTKGVLEANQAAESARLEATNKYLNDMMQNEGALAKHREEVAAGEREAQEKQISYYEALLLGVSNGTYTKDVAANLAKELGFSEDWINNINNAADAYNTKVNEEKAQEALELSGKNFSAVMDSIASGVFDGYSAEEIKSIAAEMGITLTDKQMEHITSAVEKQQTKTEEAKKDVYSDNYLSIKNNITTNTTDKEIKEMVDADYIGEDEAGQLKEYRNELAVDELNSYIKSGDLLGATERADELHKSGVIDDEQYQRTYYDATVANCSQIASIDDLEGMESEINKLVESKKMSSENAEALKKYMYGNFDTVSKENYTFENGNPTIKLGDKTVTIEWVDLRDNRVDDTNTEAYLNKISSANNDANIIVIEGKMYVRVKTGVNQDIYRWFTDEGKNANRLNNLFKYASKPSAPTFNTDTSSSKPIGGSTSANAGLNAGGKTYGQFISEKLI